MTTVMDGHIVVDDKGVARIGDGGMKVSHLVMHKQANGGDPEQLQAEYPYLSLAQIHAAFAYYYDHKDDVDTQIRESLEYADRMRAQVTRQLSREELIRRRNASAFEQRP